MDLPRGLIAAALTLSLFVATEGQVAGSSECPNVTLAEGATSTLLSRTWYENRRLLNSDADTPTPRCVSYNFGAPDERNIMSLSISEMYSESDDVAQLDGVVTPINGFFNSYDVQIPLRPILPKRYDILGFDPEGSWVVLWSCSSFSGVSFQQALVLSNQRDPDPISLAPAVEVLRNNNIPEWLLMESDQREC